MKIGGLGGLVIGLLLMSGTAVEAVTTVSVGDVNVVEGTASVDIPVLIISDPPETVTDMVFRIQVADGGPQLGGVVSGPEIAGIDFSTSIWTATDFTANASPGLGVGNFDQLIEYNVSIDFITGVPVDANGVLAVVTYDTSGFTAGESFPLLISGTQAGDIQFLGLTTTPVLENGSINIVAAPDPTAVPEPITSWMGMAVLTAWVVRRRRECV